jgi:hypothetical protein
MNSDTQIEAEEIAVSANAIIKCPICHETLISAFDPEAESRAYAMATNAWKSGGRGFRSMERQDVIRTMKSVLDGAGKCWRCSSMGMG